MKLTDYLTTGYCLWIDLRTTDDNELHGSGRRIETNSDGVIIQLERDAETSTDPN